jgi:uncharacterized protein YndB with AHSA1/START domain
MTAAVDSGGTTLQLKRIVPAPREAVFAAWTEPELFRQWFGPPGGSTQRAEMDVRVGGAYRIEMRTEAGTSHLYGTYLEVEHPSRLVYTFCWDDLPMAIADTRVTVEFRTREGATEVVLTHQRQPSRDAYEFHAWGWSHCLAGLVARFEDAG